MYDRQLWFWPEFNVMIIVEFFLNGEYNIDSELPDEKLMALLNKLSDSGQDHIEEQMKAVGLEFLGPLNLPTITA